MKQSRSRGGRAATLRTAAAIAVLGLGLGWGCSPAAEEPAPAVVETPPVDLETEVAAWRARRAESLRNPEGWLSLAGLFWLDPGDHSFGADAEADLVFPAGKIAPRAGVLRRTGREISLIPADDAGLTIDGEPVSRPTPLLPDVADDGPTVVASGSLRFYVIERGDRVGVRLKDRDSPLLTGFEGMTYFPVSRKWWLEARYRRFAEPRVLRTPNVLGDVSEEEIEGEVVFTVDGVEHRLQPSGSPEEGFFLVFGDRTNGDETYGGGRFLYTDAVAADGTVVVDFNRSYCPPCVFTPWATCPLPPPENKLPVRIEAGEKMFGAAH